MGLDIPGPDAYLAATFGEGGYLSLAFPGYVPRAGQVALAHGVDRAITGHAHLLAEAGCGTGKSVAYAVPATYHAWRARASGRSVVIATANNALSEQLVGKDLPLLQRILPWPFTFGLLKGRSHYLCEKRRARAELELGAQDDFFGGSDATLLPTPKTESERQLVVLRQWAADCHAAGPEHESGDKSDLPFEPDYEQWRRYSIEAADCTRKKCAYHEHCFANAAQARARQSTVIVTNYHMLFAHLNAQHQGGALLPPFEILVMDEAHKCANIAREMFGFRITAEGIRRVAKPVRQDAPHLFDAVQRAASLFFPTLRALKHDPVRYPSRLTGDFNDAEMAAWRGLRDGMKDVAAHLARQADREEEGGGVRDDDRRGEALIQFEKAAAVLEGLDAFVNPELDEAHVYFLEEDAQGRIAIAASLVRPGERLRPWLFEAAPSPELPHGHTVVATSATLATGEGDFAFAAHELGVRDPTTLIAASPFDWAHQALFVVPENLPEPNHKDFRAAVVTNLRRTILYAGGRTLGLFTSRKMLEFAHDELFAVLRQHGIRLLKQGEAPRTKLLETFKADVTSCLFGTESFWAGVDVPGESLSCVVIDRLPFPSPDDPIAAAIAATDDKSFWRYNVPLAVLQFKQGFGRLVRSDRCKGAVVCLDGRLLTKKYGKTFLRALPAAVPKTTRLDAIVEWLPGVTRPEAPHDAGCFCETCRTPSAADRVVLAEVEDEIPF